MRFRPTVRLLLLDPERRIFMFKYEDAVALDPARPDLRIYWVTPGGGVEPGESFEAAGLRELWEETGIRLPALGPWVWRRERVIQFPDESVRFEERYFLAHVTSADVTLDNMLTHEWVTYRAHRWWTLAEMRASDEVFLPPGLLALLEPLLRGALPPEPIWLPD